MNYQQAVQVVEKYISYLNSADLAGVVALYSDGAMLEDPVGSEPLLGIDAISEFYKHGAMAADLKVELAGEIRFAGNEVAFPFELQSELHGHKIKIALIDVFKFNAEGKVISMRAFWGPENCI